jgi:O-antigen/teichoic acid export membrane protein
MKVTPRDDDAPAGPDVPTSGASVLRGGAWNAASGLATPIATLVVSVVAARVLLPAGMGRQSFIAFVVATTTTVLTAGVPYALMRYVADLAGQGKPDVARGLIRRAWRFEAVAAIVAGGALLVVSIAGAEPRAAWIFGAVTCALGVLNVVPGFVLKGFQRWRTISVISLLTGSANAAATVAVLLLGGGITGMFAVGAVATAAYFIWASKAARGVTRQMPAPAQADFVVEREAVRYAALQSVGILLTLVVWQRSEFFFLNHYSSDAQIAFYSVPFAALTAATIVPQALASTVAPAFATLVGAGETDRLRSGFGRAMRFLLMSSLAATAFVLALGPPAIRVVYGDAYRDAAPVLLILAAVLPIVPLVTTASGLFFGFGIARLPLLALAFASLVNIGLDFALIPDHGAIGAALANVGAQATAAILIVAGAVRHIGGVEWYARTLARAVAAAALAGLAAFAPQLALGDAPALAVGCATGGAALLLAGSMLRIVQREDAAWLADAAGRRPAVAWLCRVWSAPAPPSRAVPDLGK